MPREPLPWDRKETVFKGRKHERGPGYETLNGGGGATSSSSYAAPRWREPYHGSRDFPRASPRRHIQGHYRQGASYHQLYGEDYRSSEKLWMEDEGFRPSVGRYNGSRCGGNGRESRGYFRRSPYGDPGDFHRSHHEIPQVITPQSVVVPVTPLPPPPEPKPLANGPDRLVSATDDCVSSIAKAPGKSRCRTVTKSSQPDRSLGSISWKPIKWGRSVGLSSLKANRSEADVEVDDPPCPSAKDTPDQSPLSSPQGTEDGVMKKKPRLGWGQGLAKYEKQKVGGVEDVSVKNGLVPCNGTNSLDTETGVEILSLSGYHSPVMPSVITRTSPPGVEEKHCTKFDYLRNDAFDGKDFSGIASANPSEVLPTNLELIEADLDGTLNNLISDLLQLETILPGDSSFACFMSKHLLMKDEISRELEKTECDIDQFEIEMNMLETSECDDCGLHFSNLPYYSEPPASIVNGSSTLVEPFLERSLDVEAIDNSLLALTPRSSKFEHVPKIIFYGNDETSVLSDNVVDLVVDEALWKNGHLDSSLEGAGGNLIVQSIDNCSESAHKINRTGLVELILTENKDYARTAAVQFCEGPQFDIWGSNFISSLRVNDTQVKKKLAIRRGHQKVKERLLVLKYRSHLQLWKEDLYLLSIKKQHPKTNKRFDLSVRTSSGNIQKQRLFSRRYMFPVNLAPLPISEIVDFANKIILDPQIKTFRSNLKMPALLLDEEKNYFRFHTTNGLIEDPVSYEKEKVKLNPWTQEEKEVFMEKLAMLGKNFMRIASFLKHKTTADCVEFYYKNHKCGSFSEVKKRLDQRKQWQASPANNYLVASGKKMQHEVNADSLDALGMDSDVSVRNNYDSSVQHKFSIWLSYVGNNKLRPPRGRLASICMGSTGVMSRHEKENVPAAVQLADISGVPSEAVSSCLTSPTFQPAEDAKHSVFYQSLTSTIFSPPAEEVTFSDEGFGEFDSADWTDKEKSLLIKALSMHGKDFARISQCVATRSRKQCQVFFSKARKCLGLDVMISQALCKRETLRSDTDDACAVEMDSVICSPQPCSKSERVFNPSAGNTGCDGFSRTGCGSVQLETDRSSAHCESHYLGPEEIDTNADELASSLRDGHLSNMVDSQYSYDGSKEILGIVMAKDEIIKDGSSSPSPTSKPPFIRDDSPSCLKLEPDALVKQKDYVEIKPGGLELEEKAAHCWVIGSLVDGFQDGKLNSNPKKSNILSFLPVCRADENGSDSKNKVNISSIYFPHKQQYQTTHFHDMLLPFIQKRSDLPTLSMECPAKLPDPSSISFSDPPLAGTWSASLGFGKHGSKLFHDALNQKLYQQHFLSENPSVNCPTLPSGILIGYPPAAADRNHRSKAKIEPWTSSFDPSRFNCGVVSSSVPEFLFSSGSDEQGKVRPRTWSAGSAPTEQRHGSGDVKLFGQILSPHLPLVDSSKSCVIASSGDVPLPSYGSRDEITRISIPPATPSAFPVNGGHLSSCGEVLPEFRQEPFSFDSAVAAQGRSAHLSVNSVVGGSCMSVSDPMIAMKLYASRVNVFPTSLKSESWRTTGN